MKDKLIIIGLILMTILLILYAVLYFFPGKAISGVVAAITSDPVPQANNSYVRQNYQLTIVQQSGIVKKVVCEDPECIDIRIGEEVSIRERN